jgi:AraC-like DNA-binding protein
LAILASPGRWRLVGSALPVEDPPVRHAAYARWAAAHRDRHGHREILVCLEGETYEHFAGRDYRCRPGSVFFFDAGETHAAHYPRDGSSFTHLWIMVLEDHVIANLYRQRGGRSAEQRRLPLVLSRDECESLVRCWDRVRQPPPWMTVPLRRTALIAALYSVVYRAVDHWLGVPEGDDGARRRRELVAAIQRHIETHLEGALDLETLARLAGYSKYHFTRLFRECSGQTVHAYLDGCRRRRAASLLRQGARGKEIAAALGFASAAAFYNWRRRGFGPRRPEGTVSESTTRTMPTDQ